MQIAETYGNFLSEMISLQILPNSASIIEPSGNGSEVVVSECGIRFENADIGLARADAEYYLRKLNLELEQSFPTGWYCSGRKCQELKSSLHSGHHGCHWAWVECGNTPALARFTTTILAIASLDPPPPAAPPMVAVTKYNPENGGYYILQWNEKRSNIDICNPISPQLCPTSRAAAALQSLQSFSFTGESQDSKDAQAKVQELASKQILTIGDISSMRKGLQELATSSSITDSEKKKLRDTAAVLAEAERALRAPPLDTREPSAFDRPGNSPFSRGNGGAEFIPNLAVPSN